MTPSARSGSFTRRDLFVDLHPQSVHCATVCQLPGGRLLAAAYAFSYETSADTVIVTSHFGGGEWSPSEVAIDLPGIPVGNPVLWVEGSGPIQLFYVVLHGGSWTDAVICVQESTDEGRSWGAARVVHEQRGLMTKTRPLRHEGNLLLPVYDERHWCSHVLVQTVGGGGEWRLYGDTTSRGKTIQPAVVPLSDGRLLMLSRSPRGHVYESHSFNGGFSWTASQPTCLPNPNSGIELLRLQSGELLLVYNPQTVGREQLALAVTRDEARTWSEPILVEDSPGEFSYPFAIQAEDGTVHLLYTAQRTGIVHLEIDPAELARLERAERASGP